MVISYVNELNNPGTVVNVEKVWDAFVRTKCTSVKAAVTGTYDQTMALEMADKMPCENHWILDAHQTALDKALHLFQEETLGISAATVEKYLSEMMVRRSCH